MLPGSSSLLSGDIPEAEFDAEDNDGNDATRVEDVADEVDATVEEDADDVTAPEVTADEAVIVDSSEDADISGIAVAAAVVDNVPEAVGADDVDATGGSDITEEEGRAGNFGISCWMQS